MKYIFLIFLSLYFVACGKPPKNVAESAFSFNVVDVELMDSSDLSEQYAFPDFAKTYKMAATVIDASTQAPIPNESFTVDLGEEGRIVIKSDSGGKIYWNEILKFNILNNKQRIFVSRFVAPTNSPNSRVKINYSFYPYANFLQEDVAEFSLMSGDNGKGYISKKVALSWSKKQAKIYLQNSNLKITYLGPHPQGGSYRFLLETQIATKITKKNNETFEYLLKDGQFDVQLILYKEQNSNKTILLNKYLKAVEVIDSILNTQFESTTTWVEPSNNIHIALRIIPTKMADQLREFNGVLSIGKFSELANTHSLVFARHQSSQHSNFKINLAEFNDPKLKESLNINFSKLNLEYDMIEDGESPTQRSIIYRVSTCAKDLHNNQELALEKFKIQKNSGEIIQRFADGNGCIYWNERIEYRYYKPENFFTRSNIITHAATNISKTLVSYVNPWTILTIGRDELEMDKETLNRIAAREVVHPLLFLEDYYYETIGVTYHIDEFMTLNVRKNIQLNLEFFVTRYSSLTSGIDAKEEIRDGVYLLKIAFEKSYIDTRKSQVDIEQGSDFVEVKNSVTRKPLEYIYVVNKLVRVWKGHIITPVELSIHDLRLMTVRSNFLIQLQTIEQKHLNLSKNFNVEEIQTERVIQKIRERFPDKEPSLDLLIAKDSGLPSRTFVGPMVLLEIQGGADVRPTDSMNICETDDCNFLERNNPELQKRVFPHDKKF